MQCLTRFKVIFIAIFFVPSVVLSDVPPEQKKEVEYLVSFIRNSPCKLERNGKIYTGAEAIEHILKKYDYFREDINSTEDFIKYSASKSEISGRAYITHCKNSELMEGESWLLNELKRYRENQINLPPNNLPGQSAE